MYQPTPPPSQILDFQSNSVYALLTHMLEKPNIVTQQIVDCLSANYGIQAKDIIFLPIGNASNTWVYRIVTDTESFFLKIKKDVSAASLSVPRYLVDSGIDAVVAPVYSESKRLSETLDTYSIILYPYLDAKTGVEVGLTPSHWKEIGQILKRIHSTVLPEEIKNTLGVESFNPFPQTAIEEMEERVTQKDFSDDFQKQFADIWQKRRLEIRRIFERANQLGQQVQEKKSSLVLCHTDFHTSNILVSHVGKIFVVDWDAPKLAPKERDLMFMLGNEDAEQSFFEGYGQAPIDMETVAYYRHEWVGQEFLDYADRIYGSHEMGDAVKQDALVAFERLFAPGDIVEAAYRSDGSGGERHDTRQGRGR